MGEMSETHLKTLKRDKMPNGKSVETSVKTSGVRIQFIYSQLYSALYFLLMICVTEPK